MWLRRKSWRRFTATVRMIDDKSNEDCSAAIFTFGNKHFATTARMPSALHKKSKMDSD